MKDDNRLAKELSGKILGVNSKNDYAKYNSEIEGGEYVHTQGEIKEAEGNKHSKGGIKVLLEDGDRVLTDYDNIGKDFANLIKTSLGIRVSPRSSYSEVVDRFNNKIGLTELTKEQEKLTKKLLDQEDPKIDSVTRGLNIQALSGRLQKVKEKKAPLLREQKTLFDILYEEQELRKGPVVEEKEYQRGGFYREVRPNYYRPNTELTKQESAYGGASYGDVYQGNQGEALRFMQETHPYAYGNTLQSGINTENNRAYQAAIDDGYKKQLADVEKIYGKNSNEFKDFNNEVSQHLFSGDSTFAGVDGKLGTETISKPNYSFNNLPESVYNELNEAGVRTVYDLRNNDKYADYYNQYGKDLSDSWLLGIKNPTEAINGNPAGLDMNLTTNTQPVGRPSGNLLDSRDGEERRDLGLLDAVTQATFLPGANIMKPSSTLDHAKVQNYLEQVSTPQATANKGIAEIRRGTLSAMRGLESLDPQTRALMSLGLSGQTNQAIGDLTSSVEDTNARIRQGDERANAQLRSEFQDRENRSALDYEAKTFKAQGTSEANRRRYYTDLARENRRRWNTLNKMNANNAMNPDVQYVNGRFIARPGRLNYNTLQSDIERAIAEQRAAQSAGNKTKRNS